MYYVQRIYDYEPGSERTGAAVFVDRLYPRGIPKARMAGVLWLKDITPSPALREWYHADVQAHFDEFTQRSWEELHGQTEQAAIDRLKTLAQQHDVLLLTAVKNPAQSHVSVLLDYLGEPFTAA